MHLLFSRLVSSSLSFCSALAWVCVSVCLFACVAAPRPPPSSVTVSVWGDGAGPTSELRWWVAIDWRGVCALFSISPHLLLVSDRSSAAWWMAAPLYLHPLLTLFTLFRSNSLIFLPLGYSSSPRHLLPVFFFLRILTAVKQEYTSV